MIPRRRFAGGLVAAVLAASVGLAPSAADEHLPAFSSLVVDEAAAVPDAVEARVRAGLADYQARSGNQVAVAVVRTTGRRSIEDYTIDLARAWGVGQKGEDNGVLLLVAVDDRTLRIEVGRGLEGDLTDLEAGRIIRERMVPLLRRGDVANAVAQGTDAIRAQLGDRQVGRLPPPPDDGGGRGGAGGSPLLLLGLLPLLGWLAVSRRRGGWSVGGPMIWGGGWGGYGGWGGHGRGSGGGGFGGGGGGGFGGGGASGGW